jgi:hypothetical protein
VQTSVQVPIPEGERWIVTEATPEPPVSVAVAPRLTVPERGLPGSVIVTDGAVLSMRRSAITAEVTMPLPVSAVARRS